MNTPAKRMIVVVVTDENSFAIFFFRLCFSPSFGLFCLFSIIRIIPSDGMDSHLNAILCR